MLDELGLIAEIRRRFLVHDARVTVGIGDDAAVLAPMARGAVLSVDVVVEGVHFDRRWLSWQDVGWRGYAAALSDLAAMGAPPVAGLVSLILPSAFADEDVLSIVDGAAEAAGVFGAPVVGGNISRGSQLSMSSTVVGEAPPSPLLRSGARSGDHVYVTGTVGAASLGLALLAAGEAQREGGATFVARWRRPRPRTDAAAALLVVASSAADVSDGLASDLGQICAASGLGAVVELSCVPLEPGHDRLAESLGRDGDLLALAGGEDYEVVFTAGAGARVDPSLASRIGHMVDGAGVHVLDRSGQPRALTVPGHRHR